MSCPHSSAPGSSPQTCSLCLQVTQVTRIHLVGDQIIVDGKPDGSLRSRYDERYRQENADVQNPFSSAVTGPGAAKRRCTRCNLAGHNVSTCNRKPYDPEDLPNRDPVHDEETN